jgi:voltage-gated potassium channel
LAGAQEALDRFERQTAWPMMALALAIIPLLVVPLLVDLPSGVETAFFALDGLIWIAFVLEYGIRLYLAPSKRLFVSHNIIDPLFVLIPFLRPSGSSVPPAPSPCSALLEERWSCSAPSMPSKTF